jgi:phosphoribosyl-AMP cyclohydrolase
VSVDCDLDTLLLHVEQEGAACHENYRSCFFRDLTADDMPLNGTVKLES